MVFSSIIFLFFFLPLFLVCYYLTPKKIRNYTLIVFSLIFYAWGAPWFVFYLLASTLANHYIVVAMHNAKSVKIKKLWLAASITLTIGLLVYFKYANFIVENINFIRHLFGEMPLVWKRVMLPIGISFFSFQSVTYSVDIYRNQNVPQKRPLNYLLYIILFPPLIAGPIIRYNEISDQITKRRENTSDFVHGFIRFCIGLGRKVLIADVLGTEIDKVFASDFAVLDSTTAWFTIVAYTLQLYFDFSGYSDMAIGLGRMIGFKFPENFNNPYTAESVAKFWRKWHMTFSDFMRDYLYIPLGGNRVKTQARLYFNLWVVFFLSGFWHGASWNFVIYGATHGLFMVIEKLGFYKVLKKVPRVFRIAYTMMVVILARVLFRIEKLPDAVAFYKSLFKFEFGKITYDWHFLLIMLIGYFFSFVTLFKWGQKWEQQVFYSNYNSKQMAVYFPIAVILFILSVAFLTGSGFSPFIYFRF